MKEIVDIILDVSETCELGLVGYNCFVKTKVAGINVIIDFFLDEYLEKYLWIYSDS
jgi:hypothetical protein